MSALKELSIDDLTDQDLTPNQVQVWMLLQMQKMVQKMEDAYETGPQAFKKAAPPPPPPPREERYDHSRQRSALYSNMDALEIAFSNTPPPPVPPRTYKQKVSDEVSKVEISAQGGRKAEDLLIQHRPFPGKIMVSFGGGGGA